VTTVRNFEPVTTQPKPVAEATVVQVAPVLAQTVSVRRPETRTSDLGVDSTEWGWQQLRDYVVRSIEAVHGPFPRDAAKEASIFKSFASRWGALAGPIAEAAFSVFNGRWKGSPVSVTRFCKASDEYFAREIADCLVG
jgi:hypothetical protein